MEQAPTDADLVAHIDGELSAERAEWIKSWLARDEALRARLALLAKGGRPFAEAFGLVLAAAPRDRLEGMLRTLPDRSPAGNVVEMPAARHMNVRALTLRQLGLAAAGLLLFLAGGIVQRELPVLRDALGIESGEEAEDDWRQAVAEYVSLYTTDTLSGIPDDATPRERELAGLSARLGITLPFKSVSLPGLSFKRAQLLQYDGKPLGQIAYLDPVEGPLALCIYASGQPDRVPASERRIGLNIVHWSSRGRAFMLVGHLPAPRLEELASILSQQLTL
jgi:anti-sigma factor RsiW